MRSSQRYFLVLGLSCDTLSLNLNVFPTFVTKTTEPWLYGKLHFANKKSTHVRAQTHTHTHEQGMLKSQGRGGLKCEATNQRWSG